MKKSNVILLLVTLLTIFMLISCSKNKESEKENLESINVYIYDSLEWMEPIIKNEFKDYNVVFTKFDGTTKMYTRLILEKNNPKANIVVGLNEELKNKAISDNVIYTEGDKQFFDKFDYGALAFISKKDKITSFEDLKKYDKKLLLQDPRFSTTGRDFLNWTIAVYGDKWKDYWRSIKKSVYSLSKSWDESFKMFETNDEFIMLSYATDGVYSLKNYGSVSYNVSIPNEGGYIQNEYAIIVRNDRINNESIEKLKKIQSFILNEKLQKEIPFNQWMFPVNKNVILPDEYKVVPTLNKILNENKNDNQNNKNGDILKEWEKVWQE